MRKYNGIPELLEQFMRAQGSCERWVTVQELRDRFGLTRYQCNTVSGFCAGCMPGRSGSARMLFSGLIRCKGTSREIPRSTGTW